MGAALAAALMYWLVSVRGAPTLVVAQRQCEAAYAAARTMADTVAADSIHVIGARDSAALCGDLRPRSED